MEEASLAVRRARRANATTLDLNGRGLTEIPSAVFDLEKLQHLDLSNNSISFISPQIRNLKHLEVLKLDNNLITSIPDEVMGLPNLKELSTEGNPFLKATSALSQSRLRGPSTSHADSGDASGLGLGPSLRPSTAQPDGGVAFGRRGGPSFSAGGGGGAAGMGVGAAPAGVGGPSWLAAGGPGGEVSRLKDESSGDKSSSSSSRGGEAKVPSFSFKDIQLGKIIAQGGFSVVHEGTYRGCRVAVKSIFDPKVTQDLIDEMTREIVALQKVRHPFVVQIYAACRTPPKLAILLEFLPRGTLFDLLHGGPKQRVDLSREVTMRIALQVACALEHIHSVGLVHRDVKSHNVLFGSDMTAKLADFGLSHPIEGPVPSMEFAGTASYMAPELLFRRPPIKEKTDTFAFGVLLWELVTGEIPHDGLDVEAIRGKADSGAPLPLSGVLSGDLKRLISKCWSVDPGSRPSMSEVVETLERLA
uniref:non-specific serine/threonine protein kinase n=1 Tax=Chromera velia CCMP2878 TaxID=1169474 RepID=A0A0G4H9D9_9ALVE|eukprot:Cvel_25385.t1-p1 / transcript=Cvel_25385.t1 / gene=Cvel_25385 / organism=Chromera_velia_CCMP2878 / gene_product=Probable serine/threonine-protein kinase, putative / transcript_product=Probable serine/threonine-protein kinase, putative / location=Cvel_scaffold2869:7154-12638(+) / protein_length=473 / sequence_SO=supercontig / SO=protein_coding / is_pseudo=false